MFFTFLLTAVVLVNVLYLLFIARFSFGTSEKPEISDQYPVSLIICAKNEAQNLTEHLPLWLKQTHSEFELILVNDASTDNTLKVMQQFAETDPRVKIVDVENNEAFWGSKKYALTLGIKKALYRRMLFTDADCIPASPNWIQAMAGHFSKEKQLILGYGGYLRTPGLLNLIIRFETVLTAIQYFSFAKSGIAYMGVGRCLGYTSNLFYANNGFMSHMSIPSGDDDLFVQEASTPTNTALALHPDTFTYSKPKKTLVEWMRQKRRHLSTSHRYSMPFTLLLGARYIFSFVFWPLAFLSLLSESWMTASAIIIFQWTLQYVIIGAGARRLNESKLIFLIPVLELFLVFLQLIIFITGSKSKHQRWK